MLVVDNETFTKIFVRIILIRPITQGLRKVTKINSITVVSISLGRSIDTHFRPKSEV